MDLILTSYFVTKEDPQRNKYHASHDFSKMKDWYNSVKELELNGVIFQDHMVSNFVERYETENIKFEHTKLGSRSVNDERFYDFYEYLRKNRNIDRVMITDLFDVKFFKDPFELFDSDHKLYILGEQNLIGENEWMKRKYDIVDKFIDDFNPQKIYDKRTLGPGTFGTDRENALFIIEKMLGWFKKLPDSLNIDMPVFDLVVWNNFAEEEIMSGYPLHSPYKEYKEKGDFYIKHK